MKKLLINAVEFYQVYLSFDYGILAIFSPGGACKYPVRCSEYAKRSIIECGVVRGTWMAVKRIWSCR